MDDVAVTRRPGLLRRTARRVGARVWAAYAWPSYKLGYMTALDDIQRTGVQPTLEADKETAAAASFRGYIED